MTERSVYALDLGSTKVACIAARRAADGGVDVRAVSAVATTGLYRGVVTDLHETAAAIQAAVRKVQQLAGDEDIPPLVVGVGGTHLEFTTGRGLVPIFPKNRAISRDDVLQVINHSRHLTLPAGRELIQAVPRSFQIDSQRNIHRPIGMQGERIEVETHIVTGSVEGLRQVEDAVSEAGYRIGMMVAVPVASAMGVLDESGVEGGAAVVDIGGGTTSVAVFTPGGGLASTSCLPIGSQLITSDVQQLLKVGLDEAERLKIQCGTAWAASVEEDDNVDVLQAGQSDPRPMQRKVLCEIIEARVREIARYVKKQIESSCNPSDLAGGILLTGGGSELSGTDRAFESVLGEAKVRTIGPRVSGAFAEAAEKPSMSATVGLAKYVLQEEEDEIAPASGIGTWKEAIRTFKSLFSGKA